MKNRMNDLYYKITLNTPVLLYGYTKKAQDIADWLVKESYNVIAYIDIRADQLISDDSFPIYSPEDIETRIDMEESVIILCLQSIMTQLKVTDTLLKKGISKIIYVPDTRLNNYKLSSEMRQIYQKVCLKESLLGCPIPKCDAMKESKNSIRVMQDLDDYVCIPCPIQLLYAGRPYSEAIWQVKDLDVYQERVLAYADMSITLDQLYGSFFEYMMTGTGNCDRYIEVFSKMVNKSRDSYFRDRIELFELYEREHENNIDFFKETAPVAVWNTGGYFNLQDGHHRVQYLYKKGHLLIPVIISKKDYILYTNSEQEKKLKRYLSGNKFYELNNWEILNRLGGKKSAFFQIRQIIAIWELLFEKGDLVESSYLDASGSQGFFAINMSRMHAINVTIISRNIVEEKLLKLVCELMYQDKILIISDEETESKYDVIFTGELKEECVFEYWYGKVTKFLFFSFERNDVKWQELINRVDTGKYTKLLEYFDGEKWMETGAFIK